MTCLGDEAERFLGQTTEMDLRDWAGKVHSAMSLCYEDSQSCAPEAHSLPKRLIQVLNEDLDEDFVRLYQPKEKGELGDYVALSYVWGGPQKVVTTYNNLHQYLTGFSISSLGNPFATL